MRPKKPKPEIKAKEEYIKYHIAQYMLRQIYPENRRFLQFYAFKQYFDKASQKEELLRKDDSSTSPQFQKAMSNKIYDEVKLSINGANYKKSRSFRGQAKEFVINLSKSKFLYHVVAKQFLNVYSSGLQPIASTAAITAIELSVIAFIAPSFVAALPLATIGTALILIGKSFYDSYGKMQELKQQKLAKITKAIVFERELLQEQRQTKKYEDRVGITDLVELLLQKETFLALKNQAMDQGLRNKLINLSRNISENPKISNLSKQVIIQIQELHNDDYDTKLEKKFKKLPSSLKKQDKKLQVAASNQDIQSKVEDLVKRCTENLKKEKSPDRSFYQEIPYLKAHVTPDSTPVPKGKSKPSNVQHP
jgi:hypothetical protein